jgi:hypothetical protein
MNRLDADMLSITGPITGPVPICRHVAVYFHRSRRAGIATSLFFHSATP